MSRHARKGPTSPGAVLLALRGWHVRPSKATTAIAGRALCPSKLQTTPEKANLK